VTTGFQGAAFAFNLILSLSKDEVDPLYDVLVLRQAQDEDVRQVRAEAVKRAMPVLDIAEFTAAIPDYKPIVGLDPGEKTIGVAVSDVTLTVASPLALIRKTKFTEDAATLFKLMDSRKAAGIVIGLPMNMDGSEGVRCQSNRAFGRNLLRINPDLPITFWDERLSTAAVTRVLIEEHDVNRKRRAEVVDKMAAGWILQGALERMRALRPGETF